MSSVSCRNANSSLYRDYQLRGAKPTPKSVNGVADPATRQAEADALEQAVLATIAENEEQKRQGAEAFAALLGTRAELLLKLETAKSGETIELADTVVHR